jgi:hypothetical protein
MEKFTNAITNAAADLSSLLSSKPSSGDGPPGNRQKMNSGEALPLDKKVSPAFNEAQADLIKTASTKVGMALAEVFSSELSELKKTVDDKDKVIHDRVTRKAKEHQQEVKDVDGKIVQAMNDFKAKHEQCEATIVGQKKTHDDELNAMREEIQMFKEETKKSISDLRAETAASSGGGGAAASGPPGVPRHERTTACLGNLGWDLAHPEVKVRALAILNEVRATNPDDYTSISVPGSLPTSRAVVEFVSNQKLVEFKAEVDKLKKSLRDDDPTKHVYLNVAKTYEELKPSRMINKIEKMLSQFETEKPTEARVVLKADPRTRSVRVGNEIYAIVDHSNTVHFLPKATSRYSAQQLLIVKCAAA